MKDEIKRVLRLNSTEEEGRHGLYNHIIEYGYDTLSDQLYDLFLTKTQEKFTLMKELIEGEVIRYKVIPPSNEIEQIHAELCEEALIATRHYFFLKKTQKDEV